MQGRPLNVTVSVVLCALNVNKSRMVLVLQEIMICDEETSFDISIKVATISPVTECEQSNKLPDCIPVEIKSECIL